MNSNPATQGTNDFATAPRVTRVASCQLVQDTFGTTLAELCCLLGFPPIEDNEALRFLRRRVKAGQWVYATGEPLEAVFAVYAGSVKTLLIDQAGNEQILGFPHKGDLLGMDGIFGGHHASQAIALTDCELIVIPFKELAQRGPASMALENWLFRATSRELAREHALVGLLGMLSADARVARFLVSLSERFAAAGYSAKAFRLSMTRKDIGNYLGLTLETASRTLSALHAAGLIAIDQREVVINDLNALRSLERITPSAKATAIAAMRPAAALKLRPTAPRQPGSIWMGLAAA